MLCCIINVYATSENASPTVTIKDRDITITGYHYSSQPSDCVTLLVTKAGSVNSKDDILWIDQKTIQEDQSFKFPFTFPESVETGEYSYKIGFGSSGETYEGIISYTKPLPYVQDVFLYSEIRVSINNYVPVITGTLSCAEYKTAQFNIVNTTDNIEIANETITIDDGKYNLSYQLPSLLSPKEYSFSIIVTEAGQNDAAIKFSIDSSVLLVSIEGDVEVLDGGYVNISVSGDGVHDSLAISRNQTFSFSLPNILSNSSFYISIQGLKSILDSPKPVNVVKSENAMLYNALIKARPELDNSDELITPEELASITGVLDLSNKNIYSIDGLQGCTKITHLYINNNHISDLDPICGLRNLFYLVADHNDLEKIELLPKNIKLINVEKNNLKNASGIGLLDNVETIFAGSNKLTSIDWLANKDKLRYLTLDNNDLEDISPLSNCNNLVHLNLARNNISDVSPLNNKINLKFLKLSYNMIDDVSSLPNVFYHSLHVEGNNLGYENVKEFSAINLMYAAS